MEKMITINVPEGYEIDKEKSTFEKIIFKKKDEKPRSWSEYCKSNNTLNKHGIGPSSNICHYEHIRTMKEDIDKNLIGSEEEAEAFLALMQLRLLRKAWVGEWEPEYNNDTHKWHIHFQKGEPGVILSCSVHRTLSFPTREMAEEFLKCFRDLIEKAKVLL